MVSFHPSPFYRLPRHACQIFHILPHIRHAFIFSFAVHEPFVKLLQHDGDAPVGEGFVPSDAIHGKACTLLILVDEEAFGREVACEGEGEFDAGIGPVGEGGAEVDERVAERTHVPIENGRYPIRIIWLKLTVVELEIVVDD